MKKKNLIVFSICILFAVFFLLLAFKSTSSTFNKNEIKYALTVDGVKQTSFPSKGMYRVDTECTNATCKWDYDSWKLNIEDIVGEIYCNISFTSMSKTKLNDYIIRLSETTQGNNSLIHKDYNTGNYTNSASLNESEYGTTSHYSSTSSSSTSGTDVTNAFLFNDAEWSSNPSNMTSNTYYHLNFSLTAGTSYQICYELLSSDSYQQFYIYQGTTMLLHRYAGASANITGCHDLGYASSAKNLRVVQQVSTSAGTIKFHIEKTDDIINYDTGYRYVGSNPNNYVLFNNELWRIIGVMNDESHGIENTNLVKIIRDTSLGSLVLNKSGRNKWESSGLKTLLNNEYLNKENAINSDNCYSWYYSASLNAPSICNYQITGISKNSKKMLKNVVWYLGGISDINNGSILQIYGYERGQDRYIENNLTDTGYVGLIYPSDFALASNLDVSISMNHSWNNSASNNWLGRSKGEFWSITPTTDQYKTFKIDELFGISGGNSASYGSSVYPTVYLNENVYVLDGDGSITDPYIIGMDEA